MMGGSSLEELKREGERKTERGGVRGAGLIAGLQDWVGCLREKPPPWAQSRALGN